MKGWIARGRLFHKYLAVLFLLVGGMLLLSSVVNLYFSYRQTKAALIRLQRQQALAAAGRIEQFVRGIEQQVRAREHRVLEREGSPSDDHAPAVGERGAGDPDLARRQPDQPSVAAGEHGAVHDDVDPDLVARV